MIPSRYFFHDGTKYILAGNEGLAMSHFHEVRAHLHQMKRTNVYNLPILTGQKIFDDGTKAFYQLINGIENVKVYSPLKPKVLTEEVNIIEDIDIDGMVLLIPIFEASSMWNTDYEYYLEYGSLVMQSNFSPVLWIPEKEPILFTDREPPTRHTSYNYEITEMRKASIAPDHSVWEDLQSRYGGDIGGGYGDWREIGWVAQVKNDETLEDCLLFTWNEDLGWVDGVGYTRYAYGININGEWIDLYRGAYPDLPNYWWTYRTYCCEIYDFNGIPVYVFVHATGENIVYGYHYKGEMILQMYESKMNPLSAYHELETDRHETDGVARGRLRIGKKTQTIG